MYTASILLLQWRNKKYNDESKGTEAITQPWQYYIYIIYSQIYYRFPLNNPVLQHWEHFVQKANAIEAPWKATSYSGICSTHFETDYDILPPSSGTTCRLKKYAKPSILDKITQPVTIPVALQQSRLEIETSDPLQQNQKFITTRKNFQTARDKREELEKTLTQKISNLQQKLHRSKQKVKFISEVTEVLQEKLVINSSKAEALHSEFDDMQLQFPNYHAPCQL